MKQIQKGILLCADLIEQAAKKNGKIRVRLVDGYRMFSASSDKMNWVWGGAKMHHDIFWRDVKSFDIQLGLKSGKLIAEAIE